MLKTITIMDAIFREVVGTKDRIEMFKIRYLNYSSEVATAKFLSKNDLSLDIDSFDVNSRFFGLFIDDEPLGYARLTFDSKILFNHDVFKFGEYHNLWGKKNISNRGYDFPFLNYPCVPDQLLVEFFRFRDAGYTIFEAGRLASNPKFRHLASIGFSILEGGISAVLASGLDSPVAAFINCFPIMPNTMSILDLNLFMGLKHIYLTMICLNNR